MTPRLTADLDAALQQQGSPLCVTGADERTEYVILTRTQFEQLRSLFDDAAFEIEETYAAQSAAAGVAGWDDPEMDVYDAYDSHQPRAV